VLLDLSCFLRSFFLSKAACWELFIALVLSFFAESAAVSPAGLLEEALTCFQAAAKLVTASAAQVKKGVGGCYVQAR